MHGSRAARATTSRRPKWRVLTEEWCLKSQSDAGIILLAGKRGHLAARHRLDLLACHHRAVPRHAKMMLRRAPVLALLLVGWADALAPSGPSSVHARVKVDAPARAKAAVLGLAIAATAGLAPNAFAGDVEALEPPARLPNAGRVDAGANIFTSNCAACHAGGNNVIQGEKTLRAEALKEYLAGGMKESSVVTQVPAARPSLSRAANAQA